MEFYPQKSAWKLLEQSSDVTGFMFLFLRFPDLWRMGQRERRRIVGRPGKRLFRGDWIRDDQSKRPCYKSSSRIRPDSNLILFKDFWTRHIFYRETFQRINIHCSWVYVEVRGFGHEEALGWGSELLQCLGDVWGPVPGVLFTLGSSFYNFYGFIPLCYF